MGDQTVPVLGKGRMIPHLVIHGETHEPTKQQIAFQLLDHQTFAADLNEHLQQQRPQKLFRRDRRPPRVGIHLPKQRRESIQGLVDHDPDRAQEVILGHPGFGGNIAEHGLLLLILTAHNIFSCNYKLLCARLHQNLPGLPSKIKDLGEELFNNLLLNRGRFKSQLITNVHVSQFDSKEDGTLQ